MNIVEAEMQAAKRRLVSVQRARQEISDKTMSTLFELRETQNIAKEFRDKVSNAQNEKTDDLEELQKELNGLRSKEKQLAENMAQCLHETKMLSGEIYFGPTLMDIQEKWSEISEQLEVCREVEAQDFLLSIQGTMSGVLHCKIFLF
jgi:predicted nuclease with TOPRIM domain